MPRMTTEEYDAHQLKIHKGKQTERKGSAMDSFRVKSKSRKRNQPESEMLIALFDNIHAHEPGGKLGFTQYPLFARCFHVANEGYSGAKGIIKGQKRHREGVRAGIFDIFCDVPMWTLWNEETRDYIKCPGLRIELKAKGGKMSDAQTDWLAYYRETNFQAEICFSWESAWEIIIEYLGYPGLKLDNKNG